MKCPLILKAVDTAYKNLLPSGKYPFVCLNLEIPTSDVDVNVHPTKKEVRYKNPNQIFNFVYSAVLGALSVNPQIQQQKQDAQSVLPFGNYSPQRTFDKPSIEIEQDKDDEDTVYISEQDFNKIKDSAINPPATPKKYEPVYEMQVKQIDLNMQTSAEIEEKFNIIGQYRNTYVIFEENEELKIVDQHIADERYIFEKLQENLKTENIASQLLLISDVLPLEAADVELITENNEKLEKFGYKIEKISDTEVIFKKIPQVIAHVKVKDILADILENLHGDLNNLEEKMLVTMSCKAAVKAGTELNLWQMEELIKKWKTTKMPYTCPHGRPILHTFSEKEIAAFFHRNV